MAKNSVRAVLSEFRVIAPEAAEQGSGRQATTIPCFFVAHKESNETWVSHNHGQISSGRRNKLSREHHDVKLQRQTVVPPMNEMSWPDPACFAVVVTVPSMVSKPGSKLKTNGNLQLTTMVGSLSLR